MSAEPEKPVVQQGRDNASRAGAGTERSPRFEEERGGAGMPDNFQRLWTPHRMAYIKGENKPTGAGSGCTRTR